MFYNNQNIKNILTKLFELINIQKINITTTILVLLKNMTENMEADCCLLTDASILLTKIVNFYEQFLDNFEGPCKDYTEKSILIIMNCLVKLRNREVILFMIEFLMNKYYFFYDRPNVTDQRIRLSCVASIIHTSILALENMIPQEGLINNLCSLIDKHIAIFGVEEEGLNLISSMAISFNKAFEYRAEFYWNYLDSGLNMVQQPRIFKVALCCVGDFSRVYTQSFINK